jgi:hypothetical protein
MVAFSFQLTENPLIFNTSSSCTHVQSDLHTNRQVNPTRRQTDITVLPRCIPDLPPIPCHPMCLQTCRFIKRIITVARPVLANGYVPEKMQSVARPVLANDYVSEKMQSVTRPVLANGYVPEKMQSNTDTYIKTYITLSMFVYCYKVHHMSLRSEIKTFSS